MSALCAAFDVVTREQRVFEWILKTNLVRNPSTNEYLMNISRHNCCELNQLASKLRRQRMLTTVNSRVTEDNNGTILHQKLTNIIQSARTFDILLNFHFSFYFEYSSS